MGSCRTISLNVLALAVPADVVAVVAVAVAVAPVSAVAPVPSFFLPPPARSCWISFRLRLLPVPSYPLTVEQSYAFIFHVGLIRPSAHLHVVMQSSL